MVSNRSCPRTLSLVHKAPYEVTYFPAQRKLSGFIRSSEEKWVQIPVRPCGRLARTTQPHSASFSSSVEWRKSDPPPRGAGKTKCGKT